jgi:CRP/FNR family transcriptional regulator, cyclic AMP receptor protein
LSFDILSSLSEDERRAVLASTPRRRFACREILFHEGDPGDTLHLIDKGRVAVRITTAAGDAATVRVLGRGDVVGVLAVLKEVGRRAATVIALEPTETLSLDRAQFVALRAAYPAISQFVIDVLAADVRRVDSLLMDALYAPVERRLVRRLLGLADLYGADDGVAEIQLTQDDLASMAGTARATANRVLRELEEQGVIVLSRNRIRIIDRDRLVRRGR